MALDAFDRGYLEHTGNARDRLKQLLGFSVGENNAKKYDTGIRHYLDIKAGLEAASRPVDEMEEVITKADGSKTTKRMLLLSEEDSKDTNRVMALMGYDPLQWELEYCKVKRNYWDVTIKNARKEGEKHTNHAYTCEVKARPIQNRITTDVVRSILQDVELPPIEEYSYKSGKHWFEFPIYDVHLAKRANGYDLPLAVALYRRSFLDILSRIEQYRLDVDWITFPVGNDLFHVDNAHEETTAGTAVEMCASWPEMYRTGVELLIWSVEQLRPIAPLHIDYVPGNHDEVMSYCAALTLETKYQGVGGVDFDTTADPENKRKYNAYGYNLVGLCHGHEEGKRIDHLMPDEEPELWGASRYREWHLAHLHTEEVRSVGKTKVRRIPSITAIDAWHGKKGFLSQRMAQAFIWDKDTGLDTIINSNVVLESQ